MRSRAYIQNLKPFRGRIWMLFWQPGIFSIKVVVGKFLGRGVSVWILDIVSHLANLHLQVQLSLRWQASTLVLTLWFRK